MITHRNRHAIPHRGLTVFPGTILLSLLLAALFICYQLIIYIFFNVTSEKPRFR